MFSMLYHIADFDIALYQYKKYLPELELFLGVPFISFTVLSKSQVI